MQSHSFHVHPLRNCSAATPIKLRFRIPRTLKDLQCRKRKTQNPLPREIASYCPRGCQRVISPPRQNDSFMKMIFTCFHTSLVLCFQYFHCNDMGKEAYITCIMLGPLLKSFRVTWEEDKLRSRKLQGINRRSPFIKKAL